MSIGGFFATVESNVDFLTGGQMSPFDLERTSGLTDNKTSIPVDLVWKFGRHHRVEASYFNLNRHATTGPITTDFDTQTFKLGYGFSFLRDDQKDLSLFGGFHVTEIEFSEQGGATPSVASTTAFMPVIGGRFRANLTDRISAGLSLDIFVLDFDKHSGEFIDFSAFGMYQLSERFSAGGGYRFFRQDIDAGADSFIGDYRIDYRGPFATLRARF
jgi:hypothetical protein